MQRAGRRERRRGALAGLPAGRPDRPRSAPAPPHGRRGALRAARPRARPPRPPPRGPLEPPPGRSHPGHPLLRLSPGCASRSRFRTRRCAGAGAGARPRRPQDRRAPPAGAAGRRRAARLARRPWSREGRMARAPRGARGPPGGARPSSGPACWWTSSSCATGGWCCLWSRAIPWPFPRRRCCAWREGKRSAPPGARACSRKGAWCATRKPARRRRPTPGSPNAAKENPRREDPPGERKMPWRRPIVPRPLGRSIVGAGALHDRVRDGNGWDRPLRPPGPPDRTRTLRAFARPPVPRALSPSPPRASRTSRSATTLYAAPDASPLEPPPRTD